MTTSTSQRALVTGRIRRQRTAAFLRQLKANWNIFARNRLALFGFFVIILFGTAPLLYPMLRNTVWKNGMYDPVVGFDTQSAPHPAPASWIAPEQLAEDDVHRFDQNRPSYAHLLGTDTLGRDVLSVLVASTLPTFIVGVTAALTTAILGLLIAAYSAYYRGWIDFVFSHLSDAFLLLPAPIFMVAIGAFLRAQSTTIFEQIYFHFSGNSFGETASLLFPPFEFGLIYGLIAGMGGAAIVLRVDGLKVMTQSFIEASRVAGATGRFIIWRHLIPHMLPLALIYMLVAVTGAIVADGFLSFIGFNPNPLNWGTMVYYGITYQVLNFTVPWNAMIAPAVCISLFAGSFYMVSRGLHEVIEPRLRDD